MQLSTLPTVPQGLKPRYFHPFTARLKSCPDTNLNLTGIYLCQRDNHPVFPSISILSNSRKFHAKDVSQQTTWNEWITVRRQKECLTWSGRYIAIQPNFAPTSSTPCANCGSTTSPGR